MAEQHYRGVPCLEQHADLARNDGELFPFLPLPALVNSFGPFKVVLPLVTRACRMHVYLRQTCTLAVQSIGNNNMSS